MCVCVRAYVCVCNIGFGRVRGTDSLCRKKSVGGDGFSPVGRQPTRLTLSHTKVRGLVNTHSTREGGTRRGARGRIFCSNATCARTLTRKLVAPVARSPGAHHIAAPKFGWLIRYSPQRLDWGTVTGNESQAGRLNFVWVARLAALILCGANP